MAMSSIMRISLGQPDDLKGKVESYLRRNTSPGCFISGDHTNGNQTYFDISTSVREFILDSEGAHPFIYDRDIESLFTIQVLQDGDSCMMLMPSSETIIEAFNKKVNIPAARSEIVFVGTAYDRFIKIPDVKVALRPITKIIDAVCLKETITEKDVYHHRGSSKVRQYLDFLAFSGFLNKEDGSYVRGNKFKMDPEEDEEERLNKILTSVLESGGDYLQSFFNLTMLTPFIRLSNSYYYPSGISKEMLLMKPDLLKKYQQRYYNSSKPLKQIEGQVSDMRRAKIFGRNNEFIVGDGVLFERYCEGIGC